MSTRRYRSAVACESCRRRKVRCSLTVTGFPCIGCAQDRAECVVDERRSLALSRVQERRARQSQSQPHSPGHNRSNEVVPSSSQPFNNPVGKGIEASESPSHASDRIQDEERNGLEIAAAALGQPEGVGQVPFYTGDQTGITSTLDLCSPEQHLPRHLLLPMHMPASLSNEDKQYLANKGVFTLPGKEACDSLIRAYFRHVHPIMPIIEADQLLGAVAAGRLGDYNVLLVWSVFFVAVNFIPISICQSEGYESRKAMKAAMYSCAKSMYNHTTDRTTLLQSSLLLGFWHSETDQHAAPWYWTGISVNMCQILGLHRNPDNSPNNNTTTAATRRNSSITDRQRHLWRRLWWACFFRDRWMSLTLGRPMRIDLNDCDMPMARAEDLLSDLEGVGRETKEAFLPGDLEKMAEFWVMLVEMSKVLGKVLKLNYQALRGRPGLGEVEALEAQILSCQCPGVDGGGGGLSREAVFYVYHLQLHYQAILIMFYRLYGTESPEGLHPAQQQKWQHRMRREADIAASRTNDILDMLAQENLLEFALPMTPPLLIPAMQMHLLNCNSANSLSRRLRLNKLNICMMVMEEFQKVYTVASIYRGIFAKAIQQFYPRDAGVLGMYSPIWFALDANANTNADANAGEGVPAPVPAPVAVTSVPFSVDAGAGVENSLSEGDVNMNTEMTSDLIDALVDEASTFNFWETWGQLWVDQ
ncbi:Zn(II)2Cys6 transcription factor [Aspergillus glaucus CBS 516.65]|uniref:Zn(2)-C6 fungal-type domain-containing protein n=1 Tax=Aspergillus glaucus CBS 516.65 TaxID=1160497 RepID=A0A1L9VJR5_ASPGL|nr:hypothetical protein ASPGLDRAFT_35449 [Aspergillus glaucus CBS 516.65]OJJ84168.1 hypothetical protein ASPGLDRAFT_35449 [Aspergillus glaucus CBS 516.65]